MASSRQNSSQMLNSQSSSSNSTSSSHAKDKTVHGKSEAKSKHGKVIHKFTSESYLRIICEKSPSTASINDKKLLLLDKSSSSSSGHVPMSSNTIINSMNNMSKRKGTSFQITSVSVSSGNNTQQQQQQQPRMNADNNNGDDSADDLDESHTDDNISRITDYETPSFSEDTFSREDVFFAQPNAFGTAPVIPTSSQYGLAIVGPDMGGNGSNLSDVHVSVSDAGINIMGQIPNKQDVDHKNERFKVVKIESTEPFKRGRWMCMDYLDHSALQAQDDGIDGSPKEDGVDDHQHVVKTKDSGLESGLEGSDTVHHFDNGEMEHINDNDGYDQEVLRAEMMNHQSDVPMNHQASHEHHTMTSIPVQHEYYPMGQIAQSMPQGQIQQIILQDSNGVRTNSQATSNVENSSETLPTHASQQSTPLNLGGQQQQQQQQLNPSADSNNQHHAQSMTPDMIQRSLQQVSTHHQAQLPLHQGFTLPANIHMHNLGLQQQLQQQQQQQNQQQSHVNQTSNATASPLPSHDVESDSKQQDSATSQFHNQQVGTGDKQQQQHQHQQGFNEADNQHHHHQQLSASASTNDNTISDNNMNSNDGGTQTNPSPSSSAGIGTATEGVAVNSASELNSNNNANNAAAAAGDDGQSLNEDSER